MEQVLVEVAGGAATVLAPFLAGMAGGASAELEAVGGEAGAGIVRRLWSVLSPFPKVLRVADDPDDQHFDEDLEREIGRVLEANEQLAAQVARLLDEAREAGAPVPGHALAERVKAHRDLRVEGTSATARDSRAERDIVVRAQGAPPERRRAENPPERRRAEDPDAKG